MPADSQKATRAQVKSHNKRLILKTIYKENQISRAAIARMTHLTRPTVSSIVAELMAERLVKEVGQRPSAGGKPATLLSVAEDSHCLIGIDLANSQFRGALLNLRGQVQHRFSLPVNNRDGEAALALVYELIDALVAAANSPLLGIGIGAPGLINAKQGIIHRAINLNWKNLPLRKLLQTRYARPVYIVNDSQIAALGEYTFGQTKNIANLIVLKVGRGVSSGIVLNGRLHYGDGFGAGEIGHVKIEEPGQLCRCGHYGCLETIASSQAIIKQAQAIFAGDPHSALHQFAASPEAITLETTRQAFQTGDRAMQTVIARVGESLGRAAANLVGALNIQRIVIAGSVSAFGKALLLPIQETMQQSAYAPLAENTQITLSQLGDDIVILGAAALLLSNELGIV